MAPTHLHNLYSYVKPEGRFFDNYWILDHENIGIDTLFV